jgi:hypothetical protein
MRPVRIPSIIGCAAICGLALIARAIDSRADAPRADDAAAPAFLADRGTGIPTSQFGTYVRGRELLVYTFYEYTLNSDEEYKPSELGVAGDEDFRAKRTDHEGLLFLSYGITPDVEIELESALYTTAFQKKAGNDPSTLPARSKESGLGDTEGQLRWRWCKETAGRPELFGYFEAVLPLQKHRRLIGTSDWEFAQGLGAIKGTSWGTWTARAAASYPRAERKLELGELAIEYLKQTSRRWTWFLAIEGEQDEWALIAAAQLHLRRDLFIKLNNGFGITGKAPDLAPEVGVVFSLD